MDEEEGFEEEPTTTEEVTEDEEVTDATATDVTDTEDEARTEPFPEEKADYMEDDINVTDSQVMIQLKEAENEADTLRSDIANIRTVIESYQNQEELGDEEARDLGDKQMTLMQKVAALDEVTKRIEKLLRLAPKGPRASEEVTVLSDEEEEEEAFPDDLLPRVVICSSWDDMMPKVVVCMDMKKPGAGKKLEGERDENGLTPEQREALDKERRCMAEERCKLQCQLATMEDEMRTIMRENDILSRKMAQLKAEAESQPPFEFEMSVSAPNPPAHGHMDQGGHHHMGGVAGPGAEIHGRVGVPPSTPSSLRGDKSNCPCGPRNPQLPCGGPTDIPGRNVACPAMLGNLPPVPSGPPSSAGKRCRKEFNDCSCSGGMATEMPQFPMKPQPVDLNFNLNVQPQSRQGGERPTNDPNQNRSSKIAQQLQEIEMEVRRMQREIARATKDKETLKAQQATLNCAKSLLM